MKCRKHDIIEKIKNLKQIYQMNINEISSLHIEDAFCFFIHNKYPINSHCQQESLDDISIFDYFENNRIISDKLIQDWMKNHE